MTKWPELLTGRNSVSPCTRPSKTASQMDKSVPSSLENTARAPRHDVGTIPSAAPPLLLPGSGKSRPDPSPSHRPALPTPASSHRPTGRTNGKARRTVAALKSVWAWATCLPADAAMAAVPAARCETKGRSERGARRVESQVVQGRSAGQRPSRKARQQRGGDGADVAAQTGGDGRPGRHGPGLGQADQEPGHRRAALQHRGEAQARRRRFEVALQRGGQPPGGGAVSEKGERLAQRSQGKEQPAHRSGGLAATRAAGRRSAQRRRPKAISGAPRSLEPYATS